MSICLRRSWVIGSWKVGLLTASVALAATTLPGSPTWSAEGFAAPAPVTATWHTQKLTFSFQSQQSSYSCEAVGDKVWRTLFQLGAHPDMRITVAGCDVVDPLRGGSPFGFRSTSPITLRIEIATPYEIDPADREGVTGERGRRELILKATGQAAATPDIAGQIPALWSRVRVSDFKHLEPGDCELVGQIRRQLFDKIQVRVLEDHLSCLPGRQFRGQGLFEVEALLPLRMPDQSG